MEAKTLSLLFLVLVFVVGMITNWLRHRPASLKKGTQHIALIGLLLQLVCVGLALAFLIRSSQ